MPITLKRNNNEHVAYENGRRWFISRREGGKADYLHSDGEWRFTTCSDKGFTGYFHRDEAIQRLTDSGYATPGDWTEVSTDE